MLRNIQRSRLSFNIRRGFSDNFISGANAAYIELMFDQFKQDPNSVNQSWQTYFQAVEQGLETPFTAPPQYHSSVKPVDADSVNPAATGVGGVLELIKLHRAYGKHGFRLADLDPLKLHNTMSEHNPENKIPEQLLLESYGIREEDYQTVYDLSNPLVTGFLGNKTRPWKGKWKVIDLYNKLREVYCGKIGYEFMYIPFSDESNFMRSRIEADTQINYSPEQKLELFKRLARSHLLEEFFHIKFTTHKRFGLDGLEALTPLLQSIIEQSVKNGVENFVIGMPHRGRLNVMANVLDFPLDEMFGQFLGTTKRVYSEGDVKYHLGCTLEKVINNKKVTISLLMNPSHLEAVSPVVTGQTRAMQNYTGNREKTMAIIIHGDASLAGQGVCYEVTQMEDLHDYSTGGVIHIVANNNIGFTTSPRDARAGLFPTEVAKSMGMGAPVIHVNSDYMEEVDFVGKMAADWRDEFRKSIFIDLIGYRRHGHNELDEPLYTNPLMYNLIHQKKPTFLRYAKKLQNDGVFDEEGYTNIVQEIKDDMNLQFSNAKDLDQEEIMKRFRTFTEFSQIQHVDSTNTGLKLQTLQQLGMKMSELPEDLNLHPQIRKNYKQRQQSIESQKGIDWATGEALAWAATLTQEKMFVRLAGQDVQRGTFSQRHCVVHDQKVNRKTYIPLNNINPGQQANLKPINSNLSEYGALGFEYGYTLVNPNCLVHWEAQFGDFCNGAQIMIDNFIVSGEAKWGQQSGLIMLLPHGYEGQGAEHSCGRVERFLQMSSDDPYTIPYEQLANDTQISNNNIQVCVPTTPANYFHLLRRQVTRDFRKPLIIMSPKRLLRHKEAVSDLQEFTNYRVTRVYDDQNPNSLAPESIRKVIFCSGNVYYDLIERRRQVEANDIAILRVEQLAPFPFDRVIEYLQKYSKAEVFWCQEEPKNLGPWVYMQLRFETTLKSLNRDKIKYIGRSPQAAAATGYMSVHLAELDAFLTEAMNQVVKMDKSQIRQEFLERIERILQSGSIEERKFLDSLCQKLNFTIDDLIIGTKDKFKLAQRQAKIDILVKELIGQFQLHQQKQKINSAFGSMASLQSCTSKADLIQQRKARIISNNEKFERVQQHKLVIRQAEDLQRENQLKKLVGKSKAGEQAKKQYLKPKQIFKTDKQIEQDVLRPIKFTTPDRQRIANRAQVRRFNKSVQYPKHSNAEIEDRLQRIQAQLDRSAERAQSYLMAKAEKARPKSIRRNEYED